MDGLKSQSGRKRQLEAWVELPHSTSRSIIHSHARCKISAEMLKGSPPTRSTRCVSECSAKWRRVERVVCV